MTVLGGKELANHGLKCMYMKSRVESSALDAFNLPLLEISKKTIVVMLYANT